MSNQFLYHWVPKNMKGDILYPLNTLKETMPEIYNEHVKKYEGRERLLTRVIPILNCLWNDVLHLTAVHPSKVADALRKAGVNPVQFTSYQIPTELILGSDSIAYLYKDEKSVLDEKMYEEFTLDHMGQYATVPDATIEYYKDSYAQGKKPLLYHLVPHILYKGNIDTKSLEVVTS